MPPRLRPFVFCAVVSTALLVAACGDKKPEDAGAAAAPPPPQVGVVTVAAQPVALQTELPGRVEALRTAQVRARVGGIVLRRLFTEGSTVKAGQPLFTIDPAPYVAALDAADAQAARAQAALAQTTATAERYKPLAEQRAIRTMPTRSRRRRRPRPTSPPVAPRCDRRASTSATRR